MTQDEDIRVSDEFIDLCQAQLSLLFHNFLVQESAIYLTDNYHREPKLMPILVYPSSSGASRQNLLPSFSDTFMDETVINVLDDNLEAQILSADEEIDNDTPNQLVLPLIYQNIVFGLLATTRKNKPWDSHEILQVKKIAQTLAIARFIEEKQQLIQTQYGQLRHIQDLEHDHFDDFLHQLKNPLTAIRTFAKLLLRQIAPDQPSYYTSRSIIRESDRLKELISDFGQQWQAEEDQIVTVPANQSTSFFLTEQIETLTEINIIEVITPIINAIELIAAEKNIQVKSKINPSLPLVISNAKALREIVNNLLENAVKYTPENGYILVEIDSNDSNLIEVKISDTGYGIPPEDQVYIFDRRYRGVQSGSKIAGTGLGLAIVKELCEKINVKISLISPYLWQKNQQFNGTQFSLLFSKNDIVKRK